MAVSNDQQLLPASIPLRFARRVGMIAPLPRSENRVNSSDWFARTDQPVATCDAKIEAVPLPRVRRALCKVGADRGPICPDHAHSLKNT